MVAEHLLFGGGVAVVGPDLSCAPARDTIKMDRLYRQRGGAGEPGGIEIIQVDLSKKHTVPLSAPTISDFTADPGDIQRKIIELNARMVSENPGIGLRAVYDGLSTKQIEDAFIGNYYLTIAHYQYGVAKALVQAGLYALGWHTQQEIFATIGEFVEDAADYVGEDLAEVYASSLRPPTIDRACTRVVIGEERGASLKRMGVRIVKKVFERIRKALEKSGGFLATLAGMAESMISDGGTAWLIMSGCASMNTLLTGPTPTAGCRAGEFLRDVSKEACMRSVRNAAESNTPPQAPPVPPQKRNARPGPRADDALFD